MPCVHLVAVVIVAAFFVCWAPFHTQRLMTASIPDGYWTKTLLEIQSVLFFISGVVYCQIAFCNSDVVVESGDRYESESGHYFQNLDLEPHDSNSYDSVSD